MTQENDLDILAVTQVITIEFDVLETRKTKDDTVGDEYGVYDVF